MCCTCLLSLSILTIFRYHVMCNTLQKYAICVYCLHPDFLMLHLEGLMM